MLNAWHDQPFIVLTMMTTASIGHEAALNGQIEVPCSQVGYAVLESRRQQGLGTELVSRHPHQRRARRQQRTLRERLNWKPARRNLRDARRRLPRKSSRRTLASRKH
jgi:hypothetical protein